MPQTAAAQHRIVKLAALPAVHRAFTWLHLQQPQLRQWQLEMLRIPAPTFGEQARAEWFCAKFQQLGLTNPHQDAAGNVLAELPALTPAPDTPFVLLSAHLDTVFPAGTSSDPIEDGPRILCPGACDNAAGLTALLGLAAAIRHAGLALRLPILLAATVGEEGEGDLRGMRHLFQSSPYAGRIASALVLEGSGNTSAVTTSLGSRRFRITVSGPGGHAWADSGAPNPIVILARLIDHLDDLALPSTPRTTLNIGQITGGTSINSIPESASALIDLRSIDAAQLDTIAGRIQQLTAASYQQTRQIHIIDVIGNRPSAQLPPDSPILSSLYAVDRHLSLRTQLHTASTDANIPMSLGISVIAIGAGGSGGGIHTLNEWYDPTTREIALRRILFTLLDAAS